MLSALGCTVEGRGTVSAWEKGRNEMPLSALALFCREASVSADFLLFGVEHAATNAFERQLLSLFRGIDLDAQASVLSTLNTIHRAQNPQRRPSAANPFPCAAPPGSSDKALHRE